MARKLYEEASVQDIAAAIREMTGGTETYKIAQMADAVRGISGSPIVDTGLENTTQFPQMNDTVAEFVANVTYDPEDYTTTQVTDYYSRVTSYSKEEPKGLAMKLPGETDLTVSDEDRTRQESASGLHTVYNIEPLKKASVAFGGKIYKVVAEGGVRMIYAPSVYNVRDLGGWACDGGRVKYGKLFRGSEFTGGNTNEITAEDISRLRDWCGIKVDLDLRNNTESSSATASPLGTGVEYFRYSIYAYAQTLSSADRISTCVSALRKIMESVNAGKPVYFHCVSGADRTGTIAYILLSLLGVSQSDKDKEYELTAFTEESGAARFRNTNNTAANGNGWYPLVKFFRDNYTGANDNEKVAAWAVANGIAAEEINQFRSNMISGNAGDVTVPAQEFSVTNHLTNCATSNTSTKATEGDSYQASITANIGYTLDGATVSVTMGGTDITASAYTGGVIQIPRVTGAIVITVSAAVYVPSYTNILPAGLTPNTKAEAWDGKGYRNGAYASSASPYYGTDAACFCTGALAYTPGDVFYVRGAVLEGSGHERLGALSQNSCLWCKQYSALSGMATVTKLAYRYYKIELDSSHANYTSTKYIIFSAQGTADALVVTKNQEIQ